MIKDFLLVRQPVIAGWLVTVVVSGLANLGLHPDAEGQFLISTVVGAVVAAAVRAVVWCQASVDELTSTDETG